VRLAARLAHLERRLRVEPDACRLCGQVAGGLARIVVREHATGEPPRCRTCGRLPLTFTIRLEGDADEAQRPEYSTALPPVRESG
jgi:hypothetical protein